MEGQTPACGTSEDVGDMEESSSGLSTAQSDRSLGLPRRTGTQVQPVHMRRETDQSIAAGCEMQAALAKRLASCTRTALPSINWKIWDQKNLQRDAPVENG